MALDSDSVIALLDSDSTIPLGGGSTNQRSLRIYDEGFTGLFSLNPLMSALRRGDDFWTWETALACTSVAVTCADSDVFVDMNATNQLAFVSEMTVGVETVGDNATFQLVKCSSAAATGTAAAISPAYKFCTYGSDLPAVIVNTVQFNPPVPIKYSAASAESITVQYLGSDTDATVCAGIHGWFEDIPSS